MDSRISARYKVALRRPFKPLPLSFSLSALLSRDLGNGRLNGTLSWRIQDRKGVNRAF